jgi:hypothetical protein
VLMICTRAGDTALFIKTLRTSYMVFRV